MSKRLLEADPENGLAAFIHASHLLGAGQSDEAIQMLRSSTERTRLHDFGLETQLLMDDAYGAAGLSPGPAKLRSAFNLQMPYLSDLRSFVSSLKGREGSLTPDEISELQSLTASMGQRMADQSRSGTLIVHMSGIAMEKASLVGLPDEAPSPYKGLTVGQARESILAERQALQQAIDHFPLVEDTLTADPELMGRYIDRVRLIGELEANKWLQRESAK
jgi:hypothetical protein